MAIKFRQQRLLAAICLALLAAAGCGGTPPVCQVKGKVLVGGKPVEDLCIRFQSLDDPTRAALPDAAFTAADGTFSLVVKGPGEYGLTAVWPAITIKAGERIEGEDRFRGRYNDLKKPFQKFSVKQGENAVPDITFP